MFLNSVSCVPHRDTFCRCRRQQQMLRNASGKAASEAPSLGVLRWGTVLGKKVSMWGAGVMEREPELKGQKGGESREASRMQVCLWKQPSQKSSACESFFFSVISISSTFFFLRSLCQRPSDSHFGSYLARGKRGMRIITRHQFSGPRVSPCPGQSEDPPCLGTTALPQRLSSKDFSNPGT